jgi:hypothetical protein
MASDSDMISLPNPGGNLFSLISGSAISIRDPRCNVDEDQLNGGTFVDFTDSGWGLIEAFPVENERLFGIAIDELLTVDGVRLSPSKVYPQGGGQSRPHFDRNR